MKFNKVLENLSVRWIMLLAFGVGLGYLFLLPPWQQNDEPTQFEYVWLVANLEHWPKPGDFNLQLRREIAASMLEYGFYRNANVVPPLIKLDPIDIGVSQLGGMPLYYFIASLPLRLVPNFDVTFQLYLARLVSLILFIFTVYFSYKASKIIFSNLNQISLVFTLFIALLPQLAYRMTAVNDDAAAIASMTFFFWKSLEGIKHGWTWKNGLGILLGIGLCLLAKPTAWLALPLGILAILLSVFHKYQRKVWLVAFVVSGIGLFLVVDDEASLPAFFYQRKGEPQRIQAAKTVDGNYVFLTEKSKNSFFQVLDRHTLVGWVDAGFSKVTIGGWVWATQPLEISLPQLLLDGKNVTDPNKIKVGTTPTFVATQGIINKDFRIAIVNFEPGNFPEEMKVFWDCLILIPGEGSEPPPKVEKECRIVRWGEYYGLNGIRNASAEQGWFPLRPPIEKLLVSKFGKRTTDIWAILDPITSRTYFKDALGYLFRTFWGRFNWGTLPLVGQRPYRLFVGLTILAIAGLPIALGQYRTSISLSLVGFLTVSFFAGLIYTLFRFAGDWDHYYLLLPQARYFFPYIVTSAFLLCSGWYGWTSWILRSERAKSLGFVFFVLMMLAYNGWAWYTIWRFWYR